MPDNVLPKKIATMAKQVVLRNIAAGRIVSVAESCTGGLLSAALTEVPGSSVMFHSGFTTYSDQAKIKVLGVSPELIETFGAVSVATVWAMAQGALKKSGADIAVAISGVAGPGGGTLQKPIGTVVFAVATKGADPDDVHADRRDFGATKSRADIRIDATLYALELLLPPE